MLPSVRQSKLVYTCLNKSKALNLHSFQAQIYFQQRDYRVIFFDHSWNPVRTPTGFFKRETYAFEVIQAELKILCLVSF